MSDQHYFEVAQRLEAQLADARAEIASLEAKLAARDVCWHCLDCLVPAANVCERCPPPGDCDDENCQAEGCRDVRDGPS